MKQLRDQGRVKSTCISGLVTTTAWITFRVRCWCEAKHLDDWNAAAAGMPQLIRVSLPKPACVCWRSPPAASRPSCLPVGHRAARRVTCEPQARRHQHRNPLIPSQYICSGLLRTGVTPATCRTPSRACREVLSLPCTPSSMMKPCW